MERTRIPLVIAVAALGAGSLGSDCGSPAAPDDAAPPPIDAMLAGSSDAAGGRDATVAPADASPVATIADAASCTPSAVRFIVMGDTGVGDANQAMVAAAVRDKCAASGCDFVVLLGDNIYDTGVAGTDDPQWQEKFEIPYQDIDLPFYAVLGNHDYGGGGLGSEIAKGPIQVQYSAVSSKWNMPAPHYTFTWGNVGFIMLDTNSITWNTTEYGDQRLWYATALAEIGDAEWVFAAGHHPYRSNGSHGNAGAYDSIEIWGIEVGLPLPILDGAWVKDFFENTVCGTVDVVVAGHDHDRQWLDENDRLCGAELIVSGAGAKVRPLARTNNSAHFQDDTTEGFLYVHIDGNTMVGQFIDKHGVMNFERTVTK